MGTTDNSQGEGASQVEAFYNTELRGKLEPGESGKFIVIDAKSLDYEVDSSLLVGAVHLRDRHADAEMFSFRIGYDQSGCVFHGKRMTLAQ